MYNFPPKRFCVLCNKEAITAYAHIPVCEEHDKELRNEGRQDLPDYKRVVWMKAESAWMQRGRK